MNTRQMDNWILKGFVGILDIIRQRMDVENIDKMREQLKTHTNI